MKKEVVCVSYYIAFKKEKKLNTWEHCLTVFLVFKNVSI